MTLEEIQAMRPPRPAELDLLEPLVGEWEVNGVARIAGLEEVIQLAGTSSAKWDADRTHMIDTSYTSMPGMGGLTGTMLWVWDHRGGHFRILRVDGYPVSAVGKARFAEEDMTWHLAMNVRLPELNAYARGTIKIVDDNTLHWTWREWDSLMLVELADMKGTSNRARKSSGTMPMGEEE
jgi:hypothetical protein